MVRAEGEQIVYSSLAPKAITKGFGLWQAAKRSQLNK
jgi:hypothetical protein